MQKQNTRTPWVFYAGLIILFFFIVSVYFTNGLYAKYVTTADGADAARVATFDVENEVAVDAAVDLSFFDAAKLTDTVEFNVVSSSEVAVKYDVVVTMPNTGINYYWLNVELKVGDDVKSAVRVNNVYTFKDVANITANDAAAIEHDLLFSITTPGFPPTGLTNIKDGTAQITVHAEQID